MKITNQQSQQQFICVFGVLTPNTSQNKRSYFLPCYCQNLCLCNQLKQVKTQLTPPDHHKRSRHSVHISPLLSNCQRRFLLCSTFPFPLFSLVSPLRAPINFNSCICVDGQINIITVSTGATGYLVFVLLSPPSFLWASVLISVSYC